MIVNILIGVLLGSRLEHELRQYHEGSAYFAAVGITTLVLVLTGEIMPKVVAVSLGERMARLVVFPLIPIMRLLKPIADSLLAITNLLFRISHFHDVKAVPFITDEEFRIVLSNGNTQGVIEEEERQMIQGILEFREAMVREILVPRPDVIAIAEDATVRDALDTLREHEFSRVPIYRESLDTVIGLLVMKDIIPAFTKGELDRPVKEYKRQAHFVPETMTVQHFINELRRNKTHMAIVVDEYGGTEGIVTLEDALEQVVGDIQDEDEVEDTEFETIGPGEFRVSGGLPLDELSELVGIPFEDDTHETIAGFLMEKTDKILEPGDALETNGVQFEVIECEGKRATVVHVRILQDTKSGEKTSC